MYTVKQKQRHTCFFYLFCFSSCRYRSIASSLMVPPLASLASLPSFDRSLGFAMGPAADMELLKKDDIFKPLLPRMLRLFYCLDSMALDPCFERSLGSRKNTRHRNSADLEKTTLKNLFYNRALFLFGLSIRHNKQTYPILLYILWSYGHIFDNNQLSSIYIP